MSDMEQILVVVSNPPSFPVGNLDRKYLAPAAGENTPVSDAAWETIRARFRYDERSVLGHQGIRRRKLPVLECDGLGAGLGPFEDRETAWDFHGAA